MSSLHDIYLEHTIIFNMFHNERFKNKALKVLIPAMFADPICQKKFRWWQNDIPVTSIDFNDKVVIITEKEFDNSLELLQQTYYLSQLTNHTRSLNDAISKHDITRVFELVQNIPRYQQKEELGFAKESTFNLLKQLTFNNNNVLTHTDPYLTNLNFFYTPQVITVIGAMPGIGKSALAEQIMLDLSSQGAWVLDISLEMSTEIRQARYLQHLGGATLSPKSLLEKTYDPKLLMEALEEYTNPFNLETGTRLNRKLQIVSSTEALELEGLIRIIHRFCDNYELYKKHLNITSTIPPVITIDYLHEIEVKGVYEMQDKISRIVEALFRLGKERDLAQIWVVQLKKPNTYSKNYNPDNIPDYNDIDYGKVIHHRAVQEIFLHEPAKGIYTKHRRPRIGNITKTRFSELPKPLHGFYIGETLTTQF